MPALKGKSAKKFLKKIEEPLSPEKLAIFREAEAVSKAIKPARKTAE